MMLQELYHIENKKHLEVFAQGLLRCFIDTKRNHSEEDTTCGHARPRLAKDARQQRTGRQ